jgi:enamine deaminase RidA (YjgF/YER057c/UK114 family)
MSNVVSRLARAGLKLPNAPQPAASYVPYRRSGNVLYVSGQTCVVDGVPVCTGIVGRDVSVERAAEAARVCALNVLAQVGAACQGDLDRVTVLKLTGYIRCTDDFTQQPAVLDGASDLLTLALGEKGKHARAAIGTNALPRGSTVEVEAIFEIDDSSCGQPTASG